MKKLKRKQQKTNFTKLTRTGISLIVLVITIIVIVILATAIIISLNNNNPVMEANKARYESDCANMQAVFTNTVAKIMAKNTSAIAIVPCQINNEVNGVNESAGEVSYTLDYATDINNTSGKIIFDKGTNTDTVFYTGKKLPIYAAGETKWHVDSEGNISLEVSGEKYGNGVVFDPNSKAAGLYDASGVLLASWDELVNTYGMNDIETDYDYITFYAPGTPIYIFMNNEELSTGTELVIPSGVSKIGDYALYDYSFTSVTIPEGVTSIGDCAFSCCYLQSLTIPESVTSIGAYAFERGKFTSVTIPESVISIGEGAFSGCENLISIEVSENNNNYISQDGVLYDKQMTTLVQYLCSKEGQSFDIPDSVTSISGYAFIYCENLTSVTIPEGVTSIGDNAFAFCNLQSLTLPENVTSIGSSAFQYNDFASVTIPEGMISISNGTFRDCSNLTSVTIPESVTSIGRFAFNRCKKLTSITIPKSVTSIGRYAFEECSGLTSVTIPEGVTSIDNFTFNRCSGLTSVKIPESVTSIGSSAFRECSSLTSVTIPEGVTSIGGYAFKDCTNLESVYFNQLTAPTWDWKCFEKESGVMTTFYFKNSTVRDSFTTSHYYIRYGTKYPDYDWVAPTN